MNSATSQYEKLHSTQIKAWILHALEAASVDAWITDLSLPVDSDRAYEEYVGLGAVPRMKEWKGKRSAHDLREIPFIIRNRKFEAGIVVRVDDMRRDKLGLIRPHIEGLGESDIDHVNELATELVVNGHTEKCYDEQFFFDSDHAEGNSGTQSNLVSVDISTLPVPQHGSVTEPAVGEMAFAVMRGIKKLLGIVDDQKRPCNGRAKKFIAMLPVGLSDAGVASVANRIIEQGMVNILTSSGFQIMPVVNPWLDALGGWTDSFCIFRADGPRKPFIKQEETVKKLTAKAEGSDFEHDEDKHEYGIKASRAMGYNDWKTAVKVTLT